MHTLYVDGSGFPGTPGGRRGLIEALARAAARRGGEWAFGLGERELRLASEARLGVGVRSMLGRRGVRIADVCEGRRPRVEAVAWAHGVGSGLPLERSWTSHRDVLGLRHAGWVAPLPRERALAVHAMLGGERLPAARRLFLAELEEEAARAVRNTAALVLGRVRFDATCRALATAIALDLGMGVTEAARVGGLGERRVRQIRVHRDPRLFAARATLADRRLQVPLLAAPSPWGTHGQGGTGYGPRTEAHARARHR
ncbi:MAG: hypothetical protein EP330_18445 [Deltaproteobacteria bacterium]|nr:MAG: hypothetical protein EP330_18445 [Deltaproteobacteria bacterium]